MTLLHNLSCQGQFQGGVEVYCKGDLTHMARSWVKSVSQWVLKVNLRAAVGLIPRLNLWHNDRLV